MSEALSLIYDTLDVFSGKKISLKEKEPEPITLPDAKRCYEQDRVSPSTHAPAEFRSLHKVQ
ncbi:MAG: hypothetical protein LBK66_01245 [Spirochaetaceae bacterium]|jgi:hypothetical protein|nr:hypothetical protein [Spirochaetaceae bacterium]